MCHEMEAQRMMRWVVETKVGEESHELRSLHEMSEGHSQQRASKAASNPPEQAGEHPIESPIYFYVCGSHGKTKRHVQVPDEPLKQDHTAKSTDPSPLIRKVRGSSNINLNSVFIALDAKSEKHNNFHRILDTETWTFINRSSQ